MLSPLSGALLPAVGRLSVTADPAAALAPGSIVVANHTSLADPAVVLAALRRHGAEPVVLAAAGLWRIPVLGSLLRRGEHIRVHRHDRRAARALDDAAAALERGRLVLVYPEGGIAARPGAGEEPPGVFRTGPARLAALTGAAVVPVGQAGARRITSGSPARQLAGLATAPLRRPRLHVHIGAPFVPDRDPVRGTAQTRAAVTGAWRTAAAHLGEPAAPTTDALTGDRATRQRGNGMILKP
ncbi:lysophospholipid acyltransferase family protein [Streptomyces tsukubensis]|uniref:lysophospholipid acyltransferase family protein n=1 Tax=Streptomyces tsukubensis TaxID=83656 RepID=UPI0036927E7C